MNKTLLFKLAQTTICRKLNKLFVRITDYIDRANYTDYRIEMQKRISPVNWFELQQSSGLNKKLELDVKDACYKIRVFHQQSNMWNSVASLCDELKKDDNVDLCIILTGTKMDLAGLKEQMESNGLQYIEASDYKPEEDLPDAVIVYHPGAWPSYPDKLKQIGNYAKAVINLPLYIINPFSSVDKLIWNFHHDELKDSMCILDRYTYSIVTEHDQKYKKYVCAGNPKFDSIYSVFYSEVSQNKWEKLEGKKVYLWATDHGMTLNETYQDVSFDLYASSIFSYFDKNTDKALIFRPHSTLIKELMRTYWSIDDYTYIKKYINSSPNMIWDDTNDYAYAYKIADAIITDINCDVIGSSLVSNKPIAVLCRFDSEVRSYNPTITRDHINISSVRELYDFFEDINNCIDRKKKERKQLFERIVSSFDGNNGKRIKQLIIDHISQRIQ